MNDFDYGVPEEQLAQSVSFIKVWPTEGRMTALVDADSIPYIVGFCSKEEDYLAWKEEGSLPDSPMLLQRKEHANFLLNRWVEEAGCDSALLYLTDGTDNFRNEIAVSRGYKENRSEDKPPFFHEIKQWLIDFHGASLSKGNEADDEISIEAWRRHKSLLENLEAKS